MQLVAAIFAFLPLLAAVQAANGTNSTVPPVPVSEAKERASVPATSFLFTYPPVAAIPDNADGAIRNLFIDSSPALGTLPNNGLGQSWLTLVSCGVWTPHYHPRASEILYVTQGMVNMGYREENQVVLPDNTTVGGRLLNYTAQAGSSVIVPQGLVHYVSNPSCFNEAVLIASYDNRDPGVVTLAPQLFNFPSGVVAASTGLDATAVGIVQAATSQQFIISFDPVCQAGCGIQAPSTG